MTFYLYGFTKTQLKYCTNLAGLKRPKGMKPLFRLDNSRRPNMNNVSKDQKLAHAQGFAMLVAYEGDEPYMWVSTSPLAQGAPK